MNRIEEVTAFRCSDGTLFERIDAAISHEVSLDSKKPDEPIECDPVDTVDARRAHAEDDGVFPDSSSDSDT